MHSRALRSRVSSSGRHLSLLLSLATAALLALPSAGLGADPLPTTAIGDGRLRTVQVVPGTTLLDLINDGSLPDPRIQGGPWTAPGAGLARTEYEQADLDPGTLPEGDYMGWVTFTRDGNRVLLTNRLTNNVTVYDWSTRQVLANIPVGTYPAGIAVTNDYAVVACVFSNEVYVLRLSDYGVAAVIPTGEQPWIVRTNAAGTKAFVSCDIANTCEEIDLTSLSHGLTIPGFPVGIISFSFFSENGRNTITFTNYEITPDGAHIVVGDWTDSVLFYNTATGAVDHIVGGVPSCVAVALSGDGTKAAALCTTNPEGSVRRIDLASHTVTGTVVLAGHTISTFDLAVNQDASKAFLGVSNNESAFARFDSGTATFLSSTFTPFWIGVSPDHALAIGGQFRFSILDFATESLRGQVQGNTQYSGAVSPVGSRVVGFDTQRNESTLFYDYTNSAAPVFLGSTVAGLEPEGDAPRRVAITPDGHKALVSNVLSGNLSIVNLDTHTVEATLPMAARAQDVAVTSDSHWAVVCAMESHVVKIVDLTNNTIAATVATNTRPAGVSIAPDDSKAYVANVQGNTISVVVLSGAASFRQADIPCGEIGTSFVGYGVNSDVKVSPTGQYVLVAVSFENTVKVIDTSSNSIVATLATGAFPLQLAFDDSGAYAVVTNWQGNSITVLHVAGAASSVVGTFSRGQGPLRLAYDAVHDRMAVGNYTSSTVSFVNPETGALLSTQSYAAYGNVLGVLIDAAGDPVALTAGSSSPPGYVVSGPDAIALPAGPSHFDYSPVARKAAAVMPGPDYLTVVSWDVTGAPEVDAIPLSGPGALVSAFPNPIAGEGRITFALQGESSVELTLVDAAGRVLAEVARGTFTGGSHEVHLDSRAIPAGTYFLALRVNGAAADARKITIGR